MQTGRERRVVCVGDTGTEIRLLYQSKQVMQGSRLWKLEKCVL